jgi:hypothetical protein
MLGKDRGDKVELECPVCGVHVEASAKAVESGKLRCSKGHEFEVMGTLGGIEGAAPPQKSE